MDSNKDIKYKENKNKENKDNIIKETKTTEIIHEAINNSSEGWTWLGTLVLWFIIFTVLFWLIYYSLKPNFVLQKQTTQIDTGKVLLAAIVSSIILVIIVWLIKIAITKK